MQAVILAGGEGKRMRPLTLERPKPLIEVAGKPIIEHVIDALPPEVDDVIVVTGYKGDMIRERLGSSYGGRNIQYVHQWMPAGTAHALGTARHLLNDRFLFMYGDDIHGAEALAELIRHSLGMLATTHPEPSKFGVVERNPDGTLARIIEKPANPSSNLINPGGIVLDPRIFNYPAERHESGEYYLTDPISRFAAEHPFMVVEQPLWLPIGYPEDIEKAEARLRELGR